MNIEEIAQVCHEANKTICEQNGDFSQKSWNEAEQWQRDSAIAGVRFAIANPNAPDSAQHDAWCADKIADGWVFGETKDADNKTHPCLVDHSELPVFQQSKDAVFKSICNGLAKYLDIQDYLQWID